MESYTSTKPLSKKYLHYLSFTPIIPHGIRLYRPQEYGSPLNLCLYLYVSFFYYSSVFLLGCTSTSKLWYVDVLFLVFSNSRWWSSIFSFSPKRMSKVSLVLQRLWNSNLRFGGMALCYVKTTKFIVSEIMKQYCRHPLMMSSVYV